MTDYFSLSQWNFTPDYYENSLATFEFALEKVPVYRNWKVCDPGRPYSIDRRYSAMPVFTKKDIRESFPGGMLPYGCDLNRGLADGEIQLVETSGTTDDKVTNIWNQKWWDASEKASWKLNSYIEKAANGEHHEAILANPRNVGFISDEIDLPMEKRRLARFLYLNEKTNPTLWTPRMMDRMIEELSVFKPAVLEANPSLLSRLCRYITGNNKKVFQPAVIVFTYEYPTNLHYLQIKRVFNVPTASSYGTTETGYVFMQCEEGKFHQNTDFCRVDFQPFKRDCGGPLTGRILVTPFKNPWSYLLRFDTGDIVTLEESGKCKCGRNSGLILSAVSGRKVNLTLTGDGRPVTLFELDNIISNLRGIEEYKLVQTDTVSFDLQLVSRRPDKEELSIEAKTVLKSLYGKDTSISVIYEDVIQPEKSGKYLNVLALFPIQLEKYLDEDYLSGKCKE